MLLGTLPRKTRPVTHFNPLGKGPHIWYFSAQHKHWD
uniref:Uncharacterized protein n=1 Tax=Anguilla anguilla TaxID=7936 RepID=A0A0E9PC85_ANGAN